MKKTRFLCLLLVFLFTVVPIVTTGCAIKDDGNIVQASGDGDLPPIFDGEQKNFNGMKFKVLTDKDRSATQAFNIVDLVFEDNLGDDAIKNSVERREETITKTFGAKIERVIANENSASDAKLNIQKNDYDIANVYLTKVSGALNIACMNVLVDLNFDVDYIDLSEPWWDSAIIESLLLFGGAYFCLGDINTVDNDATWCVLFNKMLWESMSHKDSSELYDKVKEGVNNPGGWTTDLLKTYAKTYFKDDVNSSTPKWNMSYTGTGTYGVYLQDEVATVLMQASGNTPMKINDRSILRVQDNITNNTDFMNAIDKVYDFMGGAGNEKWLVNFNKGSYGSDDIWDTVVRAGFKANKALFFICHCGSINLMRDMEESFGILPIPKLSDQQEKYGNTIQYGNATCYIIPYGDEEMNETCAYLLEAMAYYSSNEYDEYIGENASLTYAYYDTVLKRKATRDDESWDMLDLVFDNRIFDMACALNISSINNLIVSNTTETSQNFSSGWAKIQDSLMANVSNQLEELKKGY